MALLLGNPEIVGVGSGHGPRGNTKELLVSLYMSMQFIHFHKSPYNSRHLHSMLYMDMHLHTILYIFKRFI